MTVDLTKITVPFGLLDAKTQEELIRHGGPYQRYGYRYGYDGWFDSRPDWCLKAFTYRVKPKPLTKPSIDWSHAAPEYKWLARDASGAAWLFSGVQPTRNSATELWFQSHEDFFLLEKSKRCSAKPFATYQPGTCDWRDSLVQRPE